MSEKLKLRNIEDHKSVFQKDYEHSENDLFRMLFQLVCVLDEFTVDELNRQAILAGWHCGRCKLYATIHNYIFLQKALVTMTTLTKEEIVAAFPYSSD